MNEIIIRDLIFHYNEREILHISDLTIEEGSFVSIIGGQGSGKTTFVHVLAGLLPYQGYININRTVLDSQAISRLRKAMGFVLEPSFQYFAGETVLDDLVYTLENIGLCKKEIEKRVEKITTIFDLKPFIDMSPISLSNSKKAVLSFASTLIQEPKILIIDDILFRMDPLDKKRILSILKKMNKENHMSILLFSSHLEDALYGKDILVLKQGQIVMRGLVNDILKQEKRLTKLGFNLPFMADLSNKLSYYELLELPIMDMKDMVNHLWK